MNRINALKFNIKLLLYSTYFSIRQRKTREHIEGKKKAVIFGCPDHGNAGDIAIEKAELALLENNGWDINVVHVRELLKKYKTVIKAISDNDLVCIQGGGSFGGLYPQADLERLVIFKHFKKNKIISFPQTINFTDKLFANKYKRILKKRDNIYLYFREKESFLAAKESFSFMQERIFLVPDIVMTLKSKYDRGSSNRENITLSFRRDKEKKIDNKQIAELKESLRQSGYNEITEIDTYEEIYGAIERKDGVLNRLLDTYMKSSVVITDRLHGMILAYITDTPCIATSNNNSKVRDEYNAWLKECKNIVFIDRFVVDEIIEAVKNIAGSSFKDDEASKRIEEQFESLYRMLK